MIQERMCSSVIQNRYQIMESIGEGQFGKVYRGRNKKTDATVAIKMESVESSVKLLKHETTILHYLYRKGCKCIPIVYRYGIHLDHTFLVMSYYECTLDTFLSSYTSHSNYLSICNKIIVKCIELIRQIHEHHVVHRDIKPQNFMLDSDKGLYLIDFGLSSIYVTEDGVHIPENKEDLHDHIIGNVKYMSYYIHEGFEAVRRDDMISIGYMYLQLLFGKLPWDRDNINKIDRTTDEASTMPDTHILHPANQNKKKYKIWETLVSFLQIQYKTKQIENKNIYRYLKHCYFLSFSGEPLYDSLIQLFQPE